MRYRPLQEDDAAAMDKPIIEGTKAPDFTLPGSDKKNHSLSDYLGKTVILYFYPKDDTPGCTIEAKGFGENHEKISGHNAVVLGVSRDSLASHDKFIDKFSLPFVLLSDSDEAVCKLYGVLKEKNMFGKIGVGIERTTFIIDQAGQVIKIYQKPKTEGHAEEVLAFIEALGSK